MTFPLLDLRPFKGGVRTDIRVPDGLLIVQQYSDGRPVELTWNPTYGHQVFVGASLGCPGRQQSEGDPEMSPALDPHVVPAEWTKAAYDALARRRFGPLAASLNDKTILELAGEATAVVGALWPMIVAEVAALEGRLTASDGIRAGLMDALREHRCQASA